MTALVLAPRINRARMDLASEFSYSELREALKFYGMISNKRFIRILLKFGVLVRNASGTLSFFRGKRNAYISLHHGTPVYYKRLETCLNEYYSKKPC